MSPSSALRSDAIAAAMAGDGDAARLEQLRELLIGDDRRTLRALAAWHADPAAFGDSVSAAISEAIVQRNAADDSIARALQPTIERALGESVKTNPDPLADALYPVMGPAIRRSIAETMSQTLENFNKVLEQSLSPKSMLWRVQALISGRSFAEIALLKSLDFQVEQVFLIHRESSLLLRHAVAETAIARDADLVSSMLSAIQDFVSDSFSVDSGDVLDTLRLGELTVSIEVGPQAILAVVVRGGMPEDIRRIMHETLESIHQRMHRELQRFEGDAEVFDAVHEDIRRCLVSKSAGDAERERKAPWPAVLALCAVAGIGAWHLWQSHERGVLRERVLTRLDDTPGIVVTSAIEIEGELLVTGLRDPLAPALDVVVDAAEREALGLSTRLRPWHSLDPEIVERRLARSLQLPAGVSYALDGSTLVLSGETEGAWVRDIGPVALLIPGVESLDTAGLSRLAPPPPAPLAAKPNLLAMSRGIETAVLHFESGAVNPDAASLASLPDLAARLERLRSVAKDSGFGTTVDVIGFSDPVGSAVRNREISLGRAERVVTLLAGYTNGDVVYRSVGRGSVSPALATSMENPRHVRLDIAFDPRSDGVD